MNAYTKRKGITLIEVLLAMAIGITVLIVIGNILSLSMKSLPHAEREFDRQRSLRFCAEVASKKIKSATALFLLPSVGLTESALKDDWNYLGVSADGTKIVHYSYNKNSGRHNKQILASGGQATAYDFAISKRSDGAVMDMSFSATNTVTGGTKSFAISARPLNANYIDAPTGTSQSVNVFAYRDRQIEDEKTVGAVSFVIDTSASMNKNLQGDFSANDFDKRIVAVRNALSGHADKQNRVKGIISEFSAENAVELTLIPFNLTANKPYPNAYSASGYDDYKFYDVAQRAQRTELLQDVQSLSTVVGNGSNVGDGLRRAYYSHVDFENYVRTSTAYGAAHSTENYMVIVLDGAATYASCVGGAGVNRYKDDAGDQPYLTIYNDPAEWQSAGVIGYGDRTSAVAERYVGLFGDKIKLADFKVYVVAYTEDATELAAINNIARALGAAAGDVYAVTTRNDIDLIMSNIKADIMKDLWSVRGPK